MINSISNILLDDDEKIPVFDVQMEDESSPSFSLDGGIISHNTIPGNSELRGITKPRLKNGLLCHWDFSQMEVRVLAKFANDSNLIKAFSDGVDVHKYIACFTGDTKVSLGNGSMTFEDLYKYRKSKMFKVNSLEKDSETNNFTIKRKLAFDIRISGEASKLVELTFASFGSFRCTKNHLWLTADGYVKARDLNLNSEMICSVENTLVKLKLTNKKTIKLDEPVKVYDLTEKSNHNFMLEFPNLQKAGPIVHNSRIYKKPETEVTSLQRKFAKLATFSIIYGKQVENFASDFMGGDVLAAMRLFKDFFDGFPNVKNWIDDQHYKADNKLPVYTLFGDQVKIWSRIDDIHELRRLSVNYPIQSSASSIAALAILDLHKNLNKFNIKNIPFGFTHDSNDLEFSSSNLFEFLDCLNESAVMFPRSTFDVPVDIDWEIGNSMLHMMSLEEIEKRENNRVFKFESPKNTFTDILEILKNNYEVDYEINSNDSVYNSLEDLFVGKGAYSKYFGKNVEYNKGILNLTLKG